MGGTGSGLRWNKKRTVEDSVPLLASQLSRGGLVLSGRYGTGTLSWPDPPGRSFLTVGFDLDRRDLDNAWIRLNLPGSGRRVIGLDRSRPPFGGIRWWFRCPGPTNGGPCGRRVAALYMPIGDLWFACRTCHSLTYESVQRHDKRVDFYRKNPKEAVKLLKEDPSNLSKLFLTLRAARIF